MTERLFLTLLNKSITAGWLVLVVLGLRLLFRKAPKTLLVALWALVGIRLLCPFSFESAFCLLWTAEPVPQELFSSGKNVSNKGVSGEGVSGENVSNKGVSGEGVSGENVSGKGVSGEGVSGENVSGKGVSGEGVSGENVSNKGVSGEGISGNLSAGAQEPFPKNPGSLTDVPPDRDEVRVPLPVAESSNTEQEYQKTEEYQKTDAAGGEKMTWSFLSVASLVWLAGVAGMLLSGVISYGRISLKVRESVVVKGNIRICDRIGSPFILGVFRPRIYLPSEVNEADKIYILAHETAHLKRYDHIWKPLGFLLLSVYWFHPLLWISYILLCRDIEFACDEKVIREMGEESKKPYSMALINCSIPRGILAACPLAFGEVGIKKRIQSVLKYKKPAFWIIIVAVVAFLGAGAAFLTNPEKPRETSDHLEKKDLPVYPATGGFALTPDIIVKGTFDDSREEILLRCESENGEKTIYLDGKEQLSVPEEKTILLYDIRKEDFFLELVIGEQVMVRGEEFWQVTVFRVHPYGLQEISLFPSRADNSFLIKDWDRLSFKEKFVEMYLPELEDDGIYELTPEGYLIQHNGEQTTITVQDKILFLLKQNVAVDQKSGFGIAFEELYSMAGSAHYNIYNSVDGGKSWNLAAKDFIHQNAEIEQIYFPTPDTVFCRFSVGSEIGEKSCIMSKNGGVTWEHQEGFLAMTEEELYSEAYASLQLAQTEWDSFLLKRTEKEAFLLMVPKNVEVDKAGSVADISIKMEYWQSWQAGVGVYLFAMEQRDGEIYKTVLTEYGVSQIGIYSVRKETFAGIVYLDQFAGWEEYGMKWYRFDGTGNVSRIYGNAEKENVYTYWQNHKPVLLADGRIELYWRKQAKYVEGSFESLVQDTEVKSWEGYPEYVAPYRWAEEQTFFVSEWLKDYVPREAGDGLSGPEVIREVLRADKEGELPYRIYFDNNYNGVAVMEYIPVGKEIYFAIKRLGFSHAGGLQALFIGSLDEEGRLRQCREYGGDSSQTAFLQIGTEAYLLYYAEEIWTGLPSARGGLLQLKDGTLTQKWPVTETGEPDESYWQRRTARIKDGKMEIYASEFTYFQLDGEPMVSGFERKLEEVKSFD